LKSNKAEQFTVVESSVPGFGCFFGLNDSWSKTTCSGCMLQRAELSPGRLLRGSSIVQHHITIAKLET